MKMENFKEKIQTVYINYIRYIYLTLKKAEYKIFYSSDGIFLKGEKKTYRLIPAIFTPKEIILNISISLILSILTFYYFIFYFSLPLKFFWLILALIFNGLFLFYFLPKEKETEKRINTIISISLFVLFTVLTLTGNLLECLVSSWVGLILTLFVNSFFIPFLVKVNYLKLYKIEGEKGIYIFTI